MDTDRHMIARVRGVDPRVVDWGLAVLLTIGELANAGSQPHPDLGALAVVSLIVLTTSVGWRRRDPILAALVAITGLIAFRLASGSDAYGLAELTVIPLNFYMLGRRSRGRENTVAFALVFAYWLAADGVTRTAKLAVRSAKWWGAGFCSAVCRSPLGAR